MRLPLNVHAGPAGGPLAPVTDTRPQPRRIRWRTQEPLSYKASDGLGLDSLLLLPPGRSREDGPFPLITLVHGGPYGHCIDEFQNSLPPAQLPAVAGCAVFLPNPRGGQGHDHAIGLPPDPRAALRPDLIVRDFQPGPAGIDARWCGDITCIPTDRGRLCLPAASPHPPGDLSLGPRVPARTPVVNSRVARHHRLVQPGGQPAR